MIKIRMFAAISLVAVNLLFGCLPNPIIRTTSTAETITPLTKTPVVEFTQPVTTSIATYSAAESIAKALDLLKNNGGCQLPCIWGLTPGITTTAERQNKLAPISTSFEPEFAISRSDDSENPGSIGISITRDGIESTFGLTYYENENLIEILSLVATAQKKERIVFGDDNYNNLIENYSLSQLLVNYGPTSDVLVAAWPHDPFLKAPYDPFSVVLIYKHLGIMAEYISPNQRDGEKSNGCPKESYLILRTWDPKQDVSLKKIASIAASVGINENAYDFFKSIQDAASMSTNDFYNRFKEAGSEKCLEMPSRLWTP